MRPGCTPSIIRVFFVKNSDDLEIETFFTILGFSDLSSFTFIIIYIATYGYISETVAHMKKYIPLKSLSGISILVYHQKAHIGALFMEIWIICCHDVRPMWILPMFWGSDKIKIVKWNIPLNIYVPVEIHNYCWDED